MKFKNQCSPHLSSESKQFTCFSKSDLVELTKSYNSLGNLNLPVSLTKRELFDQLSYIFKKNFNCDNEACWIDQEPVIDNLDKKSRDKFQLFTFKPKSPSGRYFILSTVDINLIMIQYELVHIDFKFLGALPSDTFEIYIGKKELLVKTIELPNINFVSIIFNLDKHNQPGSHWVSVFINKKNKSIEYFDSLGDKPNINIQKTLDFISEKFDFSILINDVIHQKGDTACGIYAIIFILYKLSYPNNYTYFSTPVRDNKMHPFRKTLFRS
jgi:hypothetical protein